MSVSPKLPADMTASLTSACKLLLTFYNETKLLIPLILRRNLETTLEGQVIGQLLPCRGCAGAACWLPSLFHPTAGEVYRNVMGRDL